MSEKMLVLKFGNPGGVGVPPDVDPRTTDLNREFVGLAPNIPGDKLQEIVPSETQLLIAGTELREMAERARRERLAGTPHAYPSKPPELRIVWEGRTTGPVRILVADKVAGFPTDWQLEVAAQELLSMSGMMRALRLQDQLQLKPKGA